MIAFTNPRLTAYFNDWPSGARRVPCTFAVEHHPKRGYRFSRTTTGKPKTTTYGGRAAIVDGADGRTYLVQFAGIYDFITVYRSDLMNADPKAIGCTNHSFWPQHPEYAILKALIDEANPV